MNTQSEIHNVNAGEIVKAIVKPVIEAGGGTTDILVLTESVLVGVALFCVKFGGDDKVLDLMFDRARERLAELRLGDLPTAGAA